MISNSIICSVKIFHKLISHSSREGLQHLTFWPNSTHYKNIVSCFWIPNSSSHTPSEVCLQILHLKFINFVYYFRMVKNQHLTAIHVSSTAIVVLCITPVRLSVVDDKIWSVMPKVVPHFQKAESWSYNFFLWTDSRNYFNV